MVWTKLAGVDNLKATRQQLYDSLCQAENTEAIRIIERDVNVRLRISDHSISLAQRVYPNHVLFAKDGPGLTSLTSVLSAYSKYDPEVFDHA